MKWQVLIGLVFAAAFSRLIPHVPNVTAVMALALFAGAHLSGRIWAVALPLLALALSDLILGFHSTQLFVYGAVALVSLASFSTLRGPLSWPRLGVSSLGASLVFFLMSNFGVWLVDHLYEKSAQGLVQCYLMALPFLGTQMVGDLLYSLALFALAELLLKRSWQKING